MSDMPLCEPMADLEVNRLFPSGPARTERFHSGDERTPRDSRADVRVFLNNGHIFIVPRAVANSSHIVWNPTVRQGKSFVRVAGGASQPYWELKPNRLAKQKVEVEEVVEIKWRVEIFGESFTAELVDDRVLISHPLWSLSGTGRDTLEATSALIEQAEELVDIYCNATLAELTPEAISLAAFLRKLA